MGEKLGLESLAKEVAQDWGVIDLGAPVLGLREDDGVLVVTTTRGTYPLDPKFWETPSDG